MPSRSIKILLCDESPDRLAALLVGLNACGFADVVCVDRVFDLWERVVKLDPDIVLIDVDSPGRDTLEQLTLIRDQQPRPVVMFTQDQKVQSIQAAIQSGVSAYITAGISSDQVKPAIQVAMATFQRFQSLKSEPSAAVAELDDRAAIDRAKLRVMADHQLPEEQAYHLMRRVAMNRKRRVADVAREILGGRSPALPVPPNPTPPA